MHCSLPWCTFADVYEAYALCRSQPLIKFEIREEDRILLIGTIGHQMTRSYNNAQYYPLWNATTKLMHFVDRILGVLEEDWREEVIGIGRQ